MKVENVTYREKHDALRRAEKILSPEFIGQFTLVAICVIAGWISQREPLFVIWFCFFYMIVFLEKSILHISRGSNSRSLFFFLLGLNFVIAGTFSALPIYLWYQPHDIYKFAAMAMLVGATLNTLLVRSKLREVLLCYLVPNGLAFVAISLCFVLEIHCTGHGLVAFVIAASIFTYMLITVKEGYKNHRKQEQIQQFLTQAQKMEALGNLSGGIAHDFNNILSVISGNLDLISDPQEIYSKEELVQEAKSAVDRGAEMTARLLAFGSPKNSLKKRQNVPQLFHEIELMLNRLIPSSITLNIEIDTNLSEIYIDKNAFQSALINLAVNAGHAMKGGGRLDMCVIVTKRKDLHDRILANTHGARHYLQLEVKDTGTGIPRELISKVKDPFFTTREAGAGTGLGLAMVSEFALQAGGFFEIMNRKDSGAKAVITLPLNDYRELQSPTNKKCASHEFQPPLGAGAANG